MVAKQQKRSNGGTHFSKVAKCINVWRNGSNHARIYECFAARHGEARADACARRLPPRPLRGRWGSLSASEGYLLLCGIAEVTGAFVDAVGRHQTSARARRRSQG
eukprot:13905376-Alexandrium_andersonii.AAC.1